MAPGDATSGDATESAVADSSVPWTTIAVIGMGLLGLGLAVGSYGEVTRVLVERGVSADAAGFGMTLFLLGQLVIVLPADRLTRVVRVRHVTGLGFLLGAIAVAMPVVADTASVHIGSRLVLGFGQGIAFIAGMQYVGRRAPAGSVATAQGLLGALFTLGLALAIAGSPTVVEMGGLAAPAVAAGGVILLGAVSAPALEAVDGPHADGELSYLEPLTDPVALVLGLGNMATFGFLMVATTWYTAVFAGFRRFPVIETLALFAVMTVLGRALGGYLASMIGERTVVQYGLLGLTLSLGLFTLALVTADPLLLALATAGTALGFSVPFGPLFGLAFSELAEDAGVTLVVMLVIGNAGALLYPWLVGLLLTGTSSYVGGFALLTGSVAVIWVAWAVVIGRGSMHK